MGLIARLRRRGTPHHITLYGKPGCHLCDDARDMLRRLSGRHPLLVDEVDIRSDPALFRRYDVRIPVMLIDETIELEAPISENAVRTALAIPRNVS